MPPHFSSLPVQGRGDSFYERLQPEPAERPPGELSDFNFWEWQKAEAAKVSVELHPERRFARARWLERCRSEPAWAVCVGQLADMYKQFLEFVSRSADLGADIHNRLSSGSTLANWESPDCGHVSRIRPCLGCEQRDFGAYESHYGWFPEPIWQAEAAFEASEPRSCACCERGHDRRPEGEIRCGSCAGALFRAVAQKECRRWGGWYWLEERLRQQAVQLVRADPIGGALEERLGFGNSWTDEIFFQTEQRERRLGGDPWFGDAGMRRMAGIRAIGTVYLPVPILDDDLKGTVVRRVTDILMELWAMANFKTPRNAGETEVRRLDADRRMHWLWQKRVEGLPLESITTPVKLRSRGEEPLLRTIREGISEAIESLR
jgi:hypothetical protein